MDVDGDGDGIMCEGSDFAQGSASFKIEWWLALVVDGDGGDSMCDGNDCAQSSLLLSLGVLVEVVSLVVTVGLIGVCGLCGGAASVQGGKLHLGMKSTLLERYA